MSTYNTDDLGYSRLLVKTSLFETDTDETNTESAITNVFTDSVSPASISSGELNGNLNVVDGYLQSSNFVTGVNGWKFDAVGNLEANTGIFRGSLYATTGTIGDWVISTDGLYYGGTGSPFIKTSETVGAGANGVLLDKDGIKVYDDVLGVVVNLPSDGSAPSFASGTIENTIFEINTNAVLRTSETVGDGSSGSAGVLINNSGVYGCGANQSLDKANFKITSTGDAYFKGTIDASNINGSEINGSNINGAIITGGLIRTAETGQRLEIDSEGIELRNGESGSAYSDATRLFNDSSYKYGNGVLGYINNTTKKVPIYINTEQTVADMHFYNRTSDPSGPAEIGDLCVVNGRLKICVAAGTPGGWMAVGAQPESSSTSTSVSPSISPSESPSLSPSKSPSLSPSKSPSLSPSTSSSLSPSLSPSLSKSLSPSISPSESASASFSPSISPSVSPSVPGSSLSPSLSSSTSISPSKSHSLSPSLSPSLSKSLSPSISKSISPSISPSPSPSAGTYIVDSYSESNQNDGLYGIGTDYGSGQSFTGNNSILTETAFYLKKYGSYTGRLQSDIYLAKSGYDYPTGSILASSEIVDGSTLSTSSYQLMEFSFSGANQINLISGTKYVAVVKQLDDQNPSAYVIAGMDSSSPSHSGMLSRHSSSLGGYWYDDYEYDLIFYVYGNPYSQSPSISPSKSHSLSPSISPSAPTYIVDSYGETNRDNGYAVYSSQPAVGQSFIGDGGTLHSVEFSLRRSYGSPTGSGYAKIYAHSGTYGTSSIPLGSPLAISDPIDVSAIDSVNYGLYNFTFSGDNKITLEDGTYYIAAFSYNGGNSSNRLGCGVDTTSPTHSGNSCIDLISSWNYNSNVDTIFYVYKDA